jgi:hypothetical protein
MNKIIIGGVLVVLSLLFVVGYLFGLSNRGIETDNLVSLATEPSDSVPQKFWGDTQDTEITPETLTQEQLLNIYSQTIQTIKNRDYDKFKELVSTEILWKLNYRFLGNLPLKAGSIVMKVEKADQTQNFYDFAIAQYINYAPPSADRVVVESLDYNNESLTNYGSAYLFNAEKNIDINLDRSGYKYTAILTCHTKGYKFFSGNESGQIIFVYENGKWKFASQYWEDTSITPESVNYVNQSGDVDDKVPNEYLINYQLESGDISDNPFEMKLDLPTMLADGNFTLEKITINKDETVKWANAFGVIQSTMVTKKDLNWSSPFLNQGNFYKNFDKSGEYKYQIVFLNNIFSGTIEVL